MNVLILGVSSAQLDAVNELKKMGHETFAVAMAKDGPAADVADHFEIINIIDIESLKNYIKANKIDAVYSVGSDIAMPVACKISEEMNLPQLISSNTAYICNHKNVLRDVLSSNCKGNIPFQVLTKKEKITIGFPAFLKPADSQGQRGIFLVNSQEEFEEKFEISKAFSREGKVIVEKYIDGPEISVNAYFVNGELKFFIASDRDTWKEYTGLIHRHIVPGVTFDKTLEQKMIEMVKEVSLKVGIQNGPAYFQIKLMDDEAYLIEVTPRLDGCHMWNILEKATNVNLIKLTFEHLLNNDTSELNKLNNKVIPMELVFWCQKPHTKMDRSKLELPNDAIHHFYYYKDGDEIRPVNGVFDKIGYYIRKL